MSYDLFFYKHRSSPLTEQTIRNYLAENVAEPNEHNNQWWFNNEDTGVYFSFETTDENDFDNYDELFERFNKDFDNVRFMFNLNFIRPDFFGQEAFPFVEKFILDLNLFILNPQSETNADNPYKPKIGELYENWASTNTMSVIEGFDKDRIHYPLADTNEIWKHNHNRLSLQAQYDEVYYVPRIYLLEEYKTKRILTQTSWAKHFPYIIPKADYILIVREKKSTLKSDETESGFISYSTFMAKFGDYLDDIELPNYKMIRTENSEKVSDIFKDLKFDKKVNKLGERISWDNVCNSRP